MIAKQESAAVRQALQKYISTKSLKKKGVSESAIGFIKRNAIVDKTEEEIDTLLLNATRINGVLLGEGDRFRDWCLENGRTVPPDELVVLMNRDPFEAAQHVKERIAEYPLIWRGWCSYHAGKGRRRV